jgi:hypothetical protein
VKDETQQALDEILASWARNIAIAAEKADKREAAHRKFAEEFNGLVESEIRPMMEEMGQYIADHGHGLTFEISEGSEHRVMLKLRKGTSPSEVGYVQYISDSDAVLVLHRGPSRPQRERRAALNEVSRDTVEQDILTLLKDMN